MKKTYIQPQSNMVNIHAEGMMAASVQMYSDEVDTSANGAQLTGKKDMWGKESMWD